MEIIKNTVKIGNSAGVLLPKKYLNSEVKIILEPLNIEKDILKILLEEKVLADLLGVYLVGSHARKEQNIESDVDILVITSNTDKKISKEKYEIICISKKELENQLNKNILPLLPMIREAKTIINKELIKNYIHYPLTKKNLKWHIDTTESAMKFAEKTLQVSKELNEKTISDDIVYSLILRLRTLYIINCIKKNKNPTKKEFLKLVKTISGSLKSYEGYLRSKSSQKTREELPIEEAGKIINYINKNIKFIEKWLKEK